MSNKNDLLGSVGEVLSVLFQRGSTAGVTISQWCLRWHLAFSQMIPRLLGSGAPLDTASEPTIEKSRGKVRNAKDAVRAVRKTADIDDAGKELERALMSLETLAVPRTPEGD